MFQHEGQAIAVYSSKLGIAIKDIDDGYESKLWSSVSQPVDDKECDHEGLSSLFHGYKYRDAEDEECKE
jgi:hypothetical protein